MLTADDHFKATDGLLARKASSGLPCLSYKSRYRETPHRWQVGESNANERTPLLDSWRLLQRATSSVYLDVNLSPL
ncbi:hypothetical protein PoB_004117400 [Plakobranchus ocellatus]|uniref:Uncharacterized protein n=1 Tax=Plakobranchus ocellatus TaxID=259542 RepID=A0AAV4B8K0_9GAST|nr:hypothetical protein PoB_004117400 [Plakobranchus ocellatus]